MGPFYQLSSSSERMDTHTHIQYTWMIYYTYHEHIYVGYTPIPFKACICGRRNQSTDPHPIECQRQARQGPEGVENSEGPATIAKVTYGQGACPSRWRSRSGMRLPVCGMEPITRFSVMNEWSGGSCDFAAREGLLLAEHNLSTNPSQAQACQTQPHSPVFLGS